MVMLPPSTLPTIVPALKQQLGLANVWELPRLRQVVVSVGLGPALQNPKFTEVVTATLRKITGQQPVPTLARQSISNFKIRQGQVVGLKVTLRGERMRSFVAKLVRVTLPRVRDFRGIDPASVDGSGNLSLGIKEHLAFPEIAPDEVEQIHGVEVTIVTTARRRADGLTLLTLLGVPFRRASAG